ncbi:hypothetical protein ACSFA2_25200 [Variovorax sp. LT2P21]|uniref:hypothetical protein n=1 Tax=Variovorax sp. LT2P21 TaxID=3443731 RepID=UPI003F461DA4
MNLVAVPDQRSSKHHGLVIIEGIMGSGKSTTMKFVAKALEDAGRSALAVHERADPHPVRATDELQNWFEPWPESTAEQLATRAISRWRSFAEEFRLGPAVPVLDGQLFHGDLTNLFLMEASFDEIAVYCEHLAGLVEPLHPLVVYGTFVANARCFAAELRNESVFNSDSRMFASDSVILVSMRCRD